MSERVIYLTLDEWMEYPFPYMRGQYGDFVGTEAKYKIACKDDYYFSAFSARFDRCSFDAEKKVMTVKHIDTTQGVNGWTYPRFVKIMQKMNLKQRHHEQRLKYRNEQALRLKNMTLHEAKEKGIVGFILEKKYPGCKHHVGYFEPLTTGEFLDYPEIWSRVYGKKTENEITLESLHDRLSKLECQLKSVAKWHC